MFSLKSLAVKFSMPLTFVFIFIVWEALVWMLQLPIYLLPPPSAIIDEFTKSWPLLLNHSIPTITAIIIGFALSAIIGIFLSIGVVYSQMLERTLYPAIVASQVVPKIAIAPLFVVWFGFGLMPKVSVSFLIAFFPVVISTVVGMRSIDPEMIQMGKSMGASALGLFLKIRFPGALPNIFAGLKTAITLAVVGVIVGEFIGSSEGLGYLLVVSSGEMKTKLVFANIVYLTFIGVLLFYIVELFEWYVIKKKKGLVRKFFKKLALQNSKNAVKG